MCWKKQLDHIKPISLELAPASSLECVELCTAGGFAQWEK